MAGGLKTTMEAETPEKYAPETFNIVRVATGLTKTERVINRRAENIKLTSETRL